MPVTYPPAPPTISGDIESIHTLLQDPTRIARRLRTLAEQRYISDVLLTGRFNVTGGAVMYQQNESIYADRQPRVVTPGGEYPLTSLGWGPWQVAAVQKWGEDAEITDESIKRLNMQPVDRAFTKLINSNVQLVDSLTLAAISSQVTQSSPAMQSWKTAGITADSIFLDVALAKANIAALKQGYNVDTVVLDDFSYARVIAAFIRSGVLPREDPSQNPLVTGDFPIIDGMRWLSTPNLPTVGEATVLDSTALGGMADEDLGGPGYVGNIKGVETKSIRVDENDLYRVRARRVTVPVVIEPACAWRITGVAA